MYTSHARDNHKKTETMHRGLSKYKKYAMGLGIPFVAHDPFLSLLRLVAHFFFQCDLIFAFSSLETAEESRGESVRQLWKDKVQDGE
jgi:hypothetical protein